EYANIAIDKWNDDARFYHGRCLNTYAWLVNKKQRGECPYNVVDAIRDAQRAIKLYKRDKTSNSDVIAANYNNLAYFYAWDVTKGQDTTQDARETLKRARGALE